MRSRRLVLGGVLAVVALVSVGTLHAAGPLTRKPLDQVERAALLALLRAVDVAQETDATSGEAALQWDSHVLKSVNQTAYVPFRLTLNGLSDGFKSAAMYVRVVSRHDGYRSSEERSALHDWVVRATPVTAPLRETVVVGPGELPVGGPGVMAGRRSIQAPAEASALLALQRKEYEREKEAAEAARKQEEARRRDPYVFPFEEYYFFDLKTAHAGNARVVERVIAVPAGEYDVFVGLLDRDRLKTSSPTILRRTLTVPDFWNQQLAVSSLILVNAVHQLKAPLSARDQREHPYTFGVAEIVPVATPAFASDDVLSVIYQICNYGAPDADVVTEYTFYRKVDGKRTLFNRTEPQELTDADLPPPLAWETQGFVMQTVPLRPFPPGQYELEITVRDRLTRGITKGTVEFGVK